MQTVSIIREKFMKKIIVTLIATIVAMLLLCFSVSAFDNNDYGGGGGYDFGGGDYGGYDYGGNDYDSSSYSGDVDPVSVIIGIGIVVVIIIISTIGGTKKKSSGGGTTRPSSMNGANVVLPNRTEQIEGIIKQKDPNFSASDLITFTKQVYIDIENAWCKRDMTPRKTGYARKPLQHHLQAGTGEDRTGRCLPLREHRYRYGLPYLV